jgi:hypothetical protein
VTVDTSVGLVGIIYFHQFICEVGENRESAGVVILFRVVLEWREASLVVRRMFRRILRMRVAHRIKVNGDMRLCCGSSIGGDGGCIVVGDVDVDKKGVVGGYITGDVDVALLFRFAMN